MTLSSGTKLGRYKIRSHLGAGGMGEVYLAVDTELNRRVAIKFLPESLAADEQARKRLVREAQAAARLDHPNICSIYEAGEEDGRSFIVMQYVEGETVDLRMKRKPLDLSESLSISAQVADALAEAHAKGIIHRDIKPSNIMITPRGQAKVMDFGLAKTMPTTEAIDTEAATLGLLTTPGTVIGTVPYMSPEQVKGEKVDARTDIFSFGVVLYEMLSGQQPFASESAAATASAILTHEPLPLARFMSEVPAELERIVVKALVKDREERYQTAKDLLIDLKRLKRHLDVQVEVERRARSGTTPGAAIPSPAGPAPQVAVSLASAIASETQPISSAEYIVSEIKQHKPGLAAALAAIILLSIAGITYYFYFARAAIDSIAVLPLVNTSGDPNTEYLSEGISEALINSLTELQQLRVIARTTAFRYKGKQIDPQAVGRELNVRAVLMGRVRQVGDALYVQVDLVDTSTGAQLWGKGVRARSLGRAFN
jgi:eukaryotic-like serine/threonine-protein kinase